MAAARLPPVRGRCGSGETQVSQNSSWDQWNFGDKTPEEKPAEPAKAPDAAPGAPNIDADALAAWLKSDPVNDPLVPTPSHPAPAGPAASPADLAALWPPAAPVDPFTGIQAPGAAPAAPVVPGASTSDWSLGFDLPPTPAAPAAPQSTAPVATPAPQPAAAPLGALDALTAPADPFAVTTPLPTGPPPVVPAPPAPAVPAAPAVGDFSLDFAGLAGPAPAGDPFSPTAATAPAAPTAPQPTAAPEPENTTATPFGPGPISMGAAAPPAPVAEVSPFGPPPPPVVMPEEARTAPPLKLEITTGRRTIEQEIQGEALIGRPDATRGVHPEIDLRLDDAVSRRHAKIFVRDGHYVLTDLDSTNGTRYNQQWLQPEREAVLKAGDEIEVGERTVIRVIEAP